jgi:hypothetical protein
MVVVVSVRGMDVARRASCPRDLGVGIVASGQAISVDIRKAGFGRDDIQQTRKSRLLPYHTYGWL